MKHKATSTAFRYGASRQFQPKKRHMPPIRIISLLHCKQQKNQQFFGKGLGPRQLFSPSCSVLVITLPNQPMQLPFRCNPVVQTPSRLSNAGRGDKERGPGFGAECVRYKPWRTSKKSATTVSHRFFRPRACFRTKTARPLPCRRDRTKEKRQRVTDTALSTTQSKRPSHLRRSPLTEPRVPLCHLRITPAPLQFGKANVQIPQRASH